MICDELRKLVSLNRLVTPIIDEIFSTVGGGYQQGGELGIIGGFALGCVILVCLCALCSSGSKGGSNNMLSVPSAEQLEESYKNVMMKLNQYQKTYKDNSQLFQANGLQYDKDIKNVCFLLKDNDIMKTVALSMVSSLPENLQTNNSIQNDFIKNLRSINFDTLTNVEDIFGPEVMNNESLQSKINELNTYLLTNYHETQSVHDRLYRTSIRHSRRKKGGGNRKNKTKGRRTKRRKSIRRKNKKRKTRRRSS